MRGRVLVVGLLLMGSAVALSACGGESSSNTKATNAKAGSASESGGALKGDDFCAFARNTTGALSQSRIDIDNPSQVKQQVEQRRAALDHAASIAPSAIKGDIETVASAYHKYVDALAAARYNYGRIAPADAFALVAGPVGIALRHENQYLASACGISTTSTSYPTSPNS